MIEYPKITVPFERDNDGTKKLMECVYVNDTIEMLKDISWEWTEKIDGTNISVEWDGHSVSFHGRTERADIPKFLLSKLEEMFLGDVNEEMFEQLFGEERVILYGEGYGNKIQKCGSDYIQDDVSFILFDVYKPDKDLWVNRDAVIDIAKSFGIDAVPHLFHGTINTAVKFVKNRPHSTIGTADMEGLVGRPYVELKDSQGKRIIVKVKVKDFI